MASGTIKAVVSKGDIANNLTTDTAGKVLDARQGKVLNDQITNIVEISPSKSASSYPAGIFPIMWPNGVTIAGVTASANLRGVAYNTRSYLHATVTNVNNSDVYTVDLNGATYAVGAISDQIGILNYIMFIDFGTISDYSPAVVGAAVDSVLETKKSSMQSKGGVPQCCFIGTINRGGQGYAVGQAYYSNGWYWQMQIHVWNGVKAYNGFNGTYTQDA